jgi:hypothetical protein
MESSYERLKRRVREVGLTGLKPYELDYLLYVLREKNLLERIIKAVIENPTPLPPIVIPPKRSFWNRLMRR